MNPVLSGGVVFSPIAFLHSMPFASAHNGVPSELTRQVNPLEPVCRVLASPFSCIMMIVASFTIDSGAAVFAFAMYSGSDLGTSEVGNSAADPEVTSAAVAMLNANPMVACLQFMSRLLERLDRPRTGSCRGSGGNLKRRRRFR